MVDDVKAFLAKMKTKNISCGEVQDMGWGVLTQLTLPGGGKLGESAMTASNLSPKTSRATWARKTESTPPE